MASNSGAVDDTAPDPIDIKVGGRIRDRRKVLGVSQEKLGDHLDITFQQIQKYERASNRISASKLVETAEFLRTTVAYLVGETDNPARPDDLDTATDDGLAALFLSPHGTELARLFPKLPPKLQTQLMALMRAMVGEE